MDARRAYVRLCVYIDATLLLTFYIKRTVANCKHARQQQRVYLTSGCKCVCFEVKKVFLFSRSGQHDFKFLRSCL